MRKSLAAAALLLLCANWWAMPFAIAQEQPQGEPETTDVVRDPDFGVGARHFGLERRVEMLQWQQRGDGFDKVWSVAAIDSRAFPSDHANPGFPIRTRRWVAQVTVDGKPLSADALRSLGQWRAFRPSFSALPGNLAATFQPEGDGLGSADNPLDPQVGDLRIRWRELTLPPLDDKLELADGHWVVAPGVEVANSATASGTASPTSSMRLDYWPWLLAGGVLGGLLLVLLRRRR